MNAVRTCLLFAITTCLLPAQDAAVAQKAAPPLVTTSFPGGTMAEFVAVVRSAQPRANIIVSNAAAAAKVPPIDLRGAGLDQALDGACAVAVAPVPVRSAEFKGNGESVFSIVEVPASAVSPASGAARERPDETQVFSLNRLTEPDPRSNGAGLPVETILSAVQVGCGDDQAMPTLRFHRESGLLFVRGSRAQVGLVKDVLSNLERDRQDRIARSTPPPPPRADVEPANKGK